MMPAGRKSDYLDQTGTTNDLAVFTPYEVTFRCFSQDLAGGVVEFRVVAAWIHRKSHQRATGGGVTAASPASGPSRRWAGTAGLWDSFGYAPPPAYGPAGARPSRGGLQTVLDEQLLSITLHVEIVKLLPGN